MKVEIEDKIEKALDPFKKAEELLLRAESSPFLHIPVGGKSEVRRRFEELESNLNQAWENAIKEHGVVYVFDLPKPVYKQICVDFTHKPGAELMGWLSSEAAKLKCEANENPYVMAGAALGLSYNLGGGNET